MKRELKHFLLLTCGSVALALAGGSVIAQQADPSVGGSTGAGPSVSEPEPAPNPVREQREQQSIDGAAGGIDPELGPISEPDAEDIGPALRVTGDGEWKRPEDSARERARREAIERAAKLNEELGKAQRGAGAGNGLIMPSLMAPEIPMVPMELLFPPEVVNAGPPPVRESRGSAIIVGALDREAGTNTRIRIPTGGEANFGSLRIKVSGCFLSHPEDTFESWAYVEVTDKGRSNKPQLAVLPQRDRSRMDATTGERVLRKSWIIASSPSVTPIDHPTYDMWLISCEGNGGAAPLPQWPGGIAPPGQSASPGGAAPPAATPVTPEQGKSTAN
jgi:hypothetical protein